MVSLWDSCSIVVITSLTECDTDQETDRLLGAQRGDERPPSEEKVFLFEPLHSVLFE